MFDVFDRPDANASCPVRNESTTALQSLNLLNSEFSLRVSRAVAGAVESESTEVTEQLIRLFQRVLNRKPTEAELIKCQQFLDASRRESTADGLSQLALVLLNTSEFVFLD